MTDFAWDQHSNPASGSGTSFGWIHPTAGVSVNGVVIWVEQVGSQSNMGVTCTYGGVSVPIQSFTPEPEINGAYYRFFLGSGIPQLANATVSISRTAGPVQQPICVTTKGEGPTKISNSVFRQFGNSTNPSQLISADDSALIFAALHSGLDDPAGISVSSPYASILSADLGSDSVAALWNTAKTIPAGKTIVGFNIATADQWSMVSLAIAEVFPGKFTSDTFLPNITYKGEDFYQKISLWWNKLRGYVNPFTSLWAAYGHATNLSVPTNTWTAEPLDTIIVDTDAIGLSSGGGFKCPVSGVYLVGATVSAPTANAGQRVVTDVMINGVAGNLAASPQGLRNSQGKSAQLEYIVAAGPTLLQLTKGDELIPAVWQDGGASVGTVVDRPQLTVRRLA